MANKPRRDQQSKRDRGRKRREAAAQKALDRSGELEEPSHDKSTRPPRDKGRGRG